MRINYGYFFYPYMCINILPNLQIAKSKIIKAPINSFYLFPSCIYFIIRNKHDRRERKRKKCETLSQSKKIFVVFM